MTTDGIPAAVQDVYFLTLHEPYEAPEHPVPINATIVHALSLLHPAVSQPGRRHDLPVATPRTHRLVLANAAQGAFWPDDNSSARQRSPIGCRTSLTRRNNVRRPVTIHSPPTPNGDTSNPSTRPAPWRAPRS
jgi:hypothetical protein